MSAILDPKAAHEVFGSNRPEAGKNFFNLVDSGVEGLVVGRQLLEQLYESPARDWTRQAVNAGLIRRVRESEVAARTEQLENDDCCRSDDPHVIALAQVSGARLLYTNDGLLREDFSDKKLLNKPTGKVYLPRRNEGRQSFEADRERERLTRALWAAFEDAPLEDGMDHPAEEIIGNALRTKGQQKTVLQWLGSLSLEAKHASFAASIFRCLARQVRPGTTSWRTELVRDALASDDVEIRDAAAQAAELWGDRDIVEVLISHQEPVAWLRDYIEEVTRDLRN